MMGGRIWVESPWTNLATGACLAGSAFHFEVCLAPGHATPAAGPASSRSVEGTSSRLGPLRILVAEDNAVNQLLARRRLTKDGHEVLVAGDGEEALALLEREALHHRPVDLILMDIQMPKLDGFQTTLVIRERERLSGEHIPIIALTAHALEGFREQSFDAGMDGFVTKPIQFEELRSEIAAVLAGRGVANPT